MDLNKDGAALHSVALSVSEFDLLQKIAERFDRSGAGVRLFGDPVVAELLRAEGSICLLASKALGGNAKPVRAILFDKKPGTNWALGWHQDRTIVVKEHVETDGFGPWTTKSGLHHVEPPISTFDQMVTLRVHLDRVDEGNAPLLVVLGSHLLGRIKSQEIESVVAKFGQFSCLAEPRDIWIYRTPILHASEASKGQNRRRVLQVDFACGDLPGKLEWLGI